MSERSDNQRQGERHDHAGHRPDDVPVLEMREVQPVSGTPAVSGRNILWLSLGLGASAVVATAVGFWFGVDQSPPPATPEKPASVAAEVPQALPPSPPQTPAAERPVATRPEYDVPIALHGGPDDAKGLRLEVATSRLRAYDDSFSYALNGSIAVDERELQKLRVRVELLSESGEVLHQEHADARSEYLPSLRPGDSAPLRILIFEKEPAPAVASARLVVELADRPPAAARYSEGREVALAWQIPELEHIDVEVRERNSQVKDLLDDTSHWLTLAIANRGERPVRNFRVEVTWLGPGDTVLASERRYLVSSGMTPLPAGHTWVHRVIGKLGKTGESPGFERYTVAVVEAD